jgi:hypothetical protein
MSRARTICIPKNISFRSSCRKRQSGAEGYLSEAAAAVGRTHRLGDAPILQLLRQHYDAQRFVLSMREL